MLWIAYVILLQLEMQLLYTLCTKLQNKHNIYTGHSLLGRRPTGVAHSKITRVRVLSWPLPVQTSLYFLTVTKYWVTCHEILSHEISNEHIRIVRVTSTLS